MVPFLIHNPPAPFSMVSIIGEVSGMKFDVKHTGFVHDVFVNSDHVGGFGVG